MDYNAANVSPKYNVGNCFGAYYNSDFNEKTGPIYEYCPAGKLEYGTSSCKSNAIVETDEYHIQKSNAANGYTNQMELTGSTAANYRIEPGAQQKPFTIGNKENSEIRNNRDIWSNDLKTVKSKEGFGTYPTNNTFVTSALQPEDRFMETQQPPDKNTLKTIADDIKRIGKDFGNTVLYNITFGKVDHRENKESFSESAQSKFVNAAMWICIILLFFLVFALAFYIWSNHSSDVAITAIDKYIGANGEDSFNKYYWCTVSCVPRNTVKHTIQGCKWCYGKIKNAICKHKDSSSDVQPLLTNNDANGLSGGYANGSDGYYDVF